MGGDKKGKKKEKKKKEKQKRVARELTLPCAVIGVCDFSDMGPSSDFHSSRTLWRNAVSKDKSLKLRTSCGVVGAHLHKMSSEYVYRCLENFCCLRQPNLCSKTPISLAPGVSRTLAAFCPSPRPFLHSRATSVLSLISLISLSEMLISQCKSLWAWVVSNVK